MMEDQFLIPIDDAIEEFRHHLDAHDRTILSARFGDGKSFFLSHFMEDSDVAERYTFLTIFPVNYQVAENRDIFDLIKRDILLQMLFKGVIETDIEMSDEEALALYIQCQPFSFIEEFIPLIADLATSEEPTRVAAIALGIKKVFKTIKQKLDIIKQQSEDSRLDQFFNAVEQNPIVGQDAISGIIQKGIKQYKDKHPNKQVVLVIEDMDRIDPAHLFRILNVFSAHIDYCYRLGLQPNETLAGNKIGLDKVVFVLDYNNLKCIYSHFYGSDTSFDGYIEKFCSSNHYHYSLQEQCCSFYMKQISKETNLNASILNMLIQPSDFNKKSIRKVVNAIVRSRDFVISISKVRNREGEIVSLHTGMLRLIAILRKLGFSDSNIISRLKNAIVNKNSSSSGVFEYLAPYLTLVKFNNPLADLRFANSMEITNIVHVEYIEDDGRAHCSFGSIWDVDNTSEDQLLILLERVLKMVAN